LEEIRIGGQGIRGGSSDASSFGGEKRNIFNCLE